jgi:transcription elongation GreA/GreB family factor
VNKAKAIEKIIEKLLADRELYEKAARASHNEATHEQNKAENKYDTRGLEAAYLAGAQARQAAEVEATLADIRKVSARTFAPRDPADVGALVQLVNGKEISWYFLAPRGGGTEVRVGKEELLVLTPQSPLGAQLIGKRQGEKIELKRPGLTNKYVIMSVS